MRQRRSTFGGLVMAVVCAVLAVTAIALAYRVVMLTDLLERLNREPTCPCPTTLPFEDWEQDDSVVDSVAALSEEIAAVQAEQERLRAAVQEATRVHDNRPGRRRE